MIFSFGNQEAYGNPLEPRVGIHATSLLIEVGALLIVTVLRRCLFFLSGASIALKAIRALMPTDQQRKCLEGDTCSRSGNYQGKVCLYLHEDKFHSCWPEHRRVRSHFHGKDLEAVKLIRTRQELETREGAGGSCHQVQQLQKRRRVSTQNAKRKRGGQRELEQ